MSYSLPTTFFKSSYGACCYRLKLKKILFERQVATSVSLVADPKEHEIYGYFPTDCLYLRWQVTVLFPPSMISPRSLD
jgi:hypothetical protein